MRQLIRPRRRHRHPAGNVPASLTEDGFLGGRLRILQPEKGFRAGIDSVFLAAAIPCARR